MILTTDIIYTYLKKCCQTQCNIHITTIILYERLELHGKTYCHTEINNASDAFHTFSCVLE